VIDVQIYPSVERGCTRELRQRKTFWADSWE